MTAMHTTITAMPVNRGYIAAAIAAMRTSCSGAASVGVGIIRKQTELVMMPKHAYEVGGSDRSITSVTAASTRAAITHQTCSNGMRCAVDTTVTTRLDDRMTAGYSGG